MKTCAKCKKEKDESEFYKNKKSPDGLMYYCKKCGHASSIKTRLIHNHYDKSDNYKVGKFLFF